jgi:hypothetical protein
MLEIILISMVIPLGAFAAVVALERRNYGTSEDELHTVDAPPPPSLKLIRERRQLAWNAIKPYPTAVARVFPLTFPYAENPGSPSPREVRQLKATGTNR